MFSRRKLSDTEMWVSNLGLDYDESELLERYPGALSFKINEKWDGSPDPAQGVITFESHLHKKGALCSINGLDFFSVEPLFNNKKLFGYAHKPTDVLKIRNVNGSRNEVEELFDGCIKAIRRFDDTWDLLFDDGERRNAAKDEMLSKSGPTLNGQKLFVVMDVNMRLAFPVLQERRQGGPQGGRQGGRPQFGQRQQSRFSDDE